jgi:hypothetical protein
MKPTTLPAPTVGLHHHTRLAGGCTNRVASHVEFGTHFGVLSRADTKFNATLWARDKLQFKFGESALFGCEEKRMQSWPSINRRAA